MVLLDLFKDDEDILVAHFNHGTRKSADNDETFVQKRCEELGVKIIVGKSELGPNVSEEKAREARYKFLFKVREDVLKQSPNEEVKIFTAHHLDDLVESVFINLIRGTSWRGLTPFSTENVVRPFLLDDVLMPESKADILVYAARNKIVFREDPTNSSDKYLRNRIREIVSTMDPEKHFKLNQKIKTLYFSQQKKRTEIEEILDSMMPENVNGSRTWMIKFQLRFYASRLRKMRLS